ncbi:reverse transcriptase domain-containing protein [Tanacetum coccineum]
MQTRSSSKFIGGPSTNPTSTILKRPPTEGYGDAIVIPAILAENYELKHGLLNLVTSKPFYGFEKEDPHAHIRCSDLAKKKPPRSILTWEDLVSKFINQFFPPSKTTNLQNEITNFQQRFEETFSEAWEHFKDLLRACPHHGFTELHQLNTFYNALNPTDQDSLNATAGGNLLTTASRDALTIIENKSKVRNSRNKPLLQKSPPPASVKAVEEICVTCGGLHPYYQCLTTDGNVFLEYRDNIQGYVSATVQTQVAPSNELSNFKKMIDTNIKAMQNQINNVKNELRNKIQTSIQTSMSNQTNELRNIMASFFQMNTASTSGTGSLPSNTIANPKGELKSITTRSGIVLDGPSVLMPPPFINLEEDERAEETLTGLELVEYTIKVPPPLVQKPQALSQKFYEMPKRDPLHPNIPYPLRMNKEK